jgi:DNA-binding transcriptional MerR regulator
MAPGCLAPSHHRTRYASPLTFPCRPARTSENALRTTVSRPAVTTIVERLFDRAQDTPIHSICVDDITARHLAPPPQEGPTVTGMDQELLTVGLMAQRSGLTIKALRHYDRVGLLRPVTIDSATGYRQYHCDQIAEARLISLLRSLDLPLAQVRTAVAAWQDGDDGAVKQVISEHRRRLDARVTRMRGALHRADHLLAEGLETAMSVPDPMAEVATTRSKPGTGSVSNQRLLAAQLFNETWRLMEQEDRSRDDDDRMIHTAHASRYHWGQAADATPANLARGEWQISRVYTVLWRPEPALHHARRVLDICQENGIGDWDLAFAYEALARASAVAGDAGQARSYTDQALTAAKDIAEEGERAMVLADLETIPGQPRYW